MAVSREVKDISLIASMIGTALIFFISMCFTWAFKKSFFFINWFLGRD